MKVALIDTRTAVPGEIIGTLISVHQTTGAAFRANDIFQNKVGAVTKIATVQEDVIVGELVKPYHLAKEGEK